jgi:hypothetical protein
VLRTKMPGVACFPWFQLIPSRMQGPAKN